MSLLLLFDKPVAYTFNASGGLKVGGRTTDSFNRADSTDLGPNWDAGYENRHPLQIIENTIRATADGNQLETYNATLANNQSAQIQLNHRLGLFASFWGVVLRATAPPTVTFYGFVANQDYHAAGETTHIFRVVNQDFTSIASNTTEWEEGDILRAEAEGTALRLYKNEILVLSATDGNIASGRAGIWMEPEESFFNELLLDNFESSNIVYNTHLGRAVKPIGGATASGLGKTSIARTFSGSGGLTSSGNALESLGRFVKPSGGLTAGGSAETSKGESTPAFTFEASGGLTISGTAQTSLERTVFASGGLTASGDSHDSLNRHVNATGGLLAQGTASLSQAPVFQASGGATAGGDSHESLGRFFTAQGGLTAGGQATTSYILFIEGQFSFTPAGGAVSGGLAETSISRTFNASGGLSTGGQAGQSKFPEDVVQIPAVVREAGGFAAIGVFPASTSKPPFHFTHVGSGSAGLSISGSAETWSESGAHKSISTEDLSGKTLPFCPYIYRATAPKAPAKIYAFKSSGGIHWGGQSEHFYFDPYLELRLAEDEDLILELEAA